MNWQTGDNHNILMQNLTDFFLKFLCCTVGDWLCQCIGMTHVPVTQMDVLTGSYFPGSSLHKECSVFTSFIVNVNRFISVTMFCFCISFSEKH
jgi:hypothetical protein